MPDSLGLMNLGVLIAPAVVLLALERYRNRPSASTPLLQQVAWTLLFLGILGPFLAMFGWFSVFAVPAASTILLMIVDRQRNAEHRALLKLFAESAEKGVPLNEAARAFSEENATDTGLRARIFAQALDSGMSVNEAARKAWLRMSTGVRLTLAMNEKYGLLASSLKAQLAELSHIEGVFRSLAGRLLSVYLAFAFGFVLLFYRKLNVFPLVLRTYHDYGLEIPPFSLAVGYFEQIIFWEIAPLTVFIAVSIALVATPVFRYAYIGWLWRDFPFLRRWFWRYDGAIILRALAGLARQGRSFPEGIALFAKLYPRSSVRKRLLQAERRLNAGEEWTAALVSAGIIPSAEAAVLRAAERVGNVPWALEEMADQLLRRMLYRVQLLLQFLFPACALAGGVVTLIFAVAYFLPLVKLIQVLA